MDISYSQTGTTTINAKGISVLINPNKKQKADVELFSEPQTEFPEETIGFDGPGEYEVKGCMIDGIVVAPQITAYRLYLEDTRICFVPKIPEGVELDIESLGAPDVLFMPLGGRKAEATAKIISAVEPRIVIPVNYNDAELAAFLSEMGAKDTQPVEKFKFARKDLPEDKQEIVVFKD